MISALPSRVRVELPSGKARGWRSRGQPAFRISVACPPSSAKPAKRSPTATIAWWRPARSDRSAASTASTLAGGTRISRSSGPSQIASAPSPAVAVSARSGSGKPRVAPARPRTSGPPRRTSLPDCGSWRSSGASGMEPLALGVEEDGLDDPDRDRAAGHRDVKGLAHPLPAGADQCQRDRAAGAGAHVARGDVTERDGRVGIGAGGELGALLQHLGRVLGQQAHELLAVGPLQVGAGHAALADEVGLLLGDDPAHAEVERGHGAVRVLADDDVALLGAQHVHGLGAIGRDAERLAGAYERLPDWAAVAGRHVDLVGELAREADAEHARRHARDLTGAPGEVREGLRREVDVGADGAQHVARARPGERDDGPLLRDRGAVNLEFRPLGLEPLLEPGEDAGGTAGGGRHVEAVGGEARGDAVVEHVAVVPAHQAVAATAGLEAGEEVGVDAVEEGAGVGTLEVDLAERGGVEDADGLAHGPALAGGGGVQILAGARVVARSLPRSHVLEHRAALGVPAVDRCGPDRVEQLLAVEA